MILLAFTAMLFFFAHLVNGICSVLAGSKNRECYNSIKCVGLAWKWLSKMTKMSEV